jgi:hypothetical protein
MTDWQQLMLVGVLCGPQIDGSFDCLEDEAEVRDLSIQTWVARIQRRPLEQWLKDDGFVTHRKISSSE